MMESRMKELIKNAYKEAPEMVLVLVALAGILLMCLTSEIISDYLDYSVKIEALKSADRAVELIWGVK